ncbi:MAG: hypothetical protein HUN04_00955 [Desulfobacter sp.]|nr:MAG: hypothetical protein HUN04_00955 [Desulfobacter sp.]
MSAIRINGIRVGHRMFHLNQTPDPAVSPPEAPLYRNLAGKGINLPCLGVESNVLGHTLSCCTEDDSLPDHVPVCMVSVYPHGSSSHILGSLLSLFGDSNLDFFHMVSSNAMISFVIAQYDKSQVLDRLEQAFDLPPTHTPYEPGFHEETAAFVKKRYQETRAYFRENKIKTYGLDLKQGLAISGRRCSIDRLGQAGEEISALNKKFYFATAFGHAPEKSVTLYLVADQEQVHEETGFKTGTGDDGSWLANADMVYFHGPHFGDRYGIFNAAAGCLDNAGIPFLLAGCTGASITLVFEAGLGEAAVTALKTGFDTP